MPNWCTTNITFKGPKEEIKTLSKSIEEWTSKEYIKTDFGKNWLGNICIGANLITIDEAENNTKKYRYRGDIIDVEDYDDNELHVQTETAWTPMLALWVDTLKSLKLNNTEILYTASEPNLEIYYTNDPDQIDTYIWDVGLYNESEELKDLFKSVYDTTPDNNNDLLSENDELFFMDYDISKTYNDKFLAKCKKIYPNIKTIEDIPLQNPDSYIVCHPWKYMMIDDLE